MEERNVIYLATGEGLYMSTDSGATWAKKPLANGANDTEVKDIFVTDSTIYLATFTAMQCGKPSALQGGVSFSNDNGISWTHKGLAQGLQSNCMVALSVDGSSIYSLSFDSALNISKDGGLSWQVKYLDNGFHSRFYVSGTNMYRATSNNGIFISSDGGATWLHKTKNDGIGGNKVNDIYLADSTIYLATENQVSISTDGGNSWSNKPIQNSKSNDIIAISGSGTTIYAAARLGLFVSTNAAESWEELIHFEDFFEG
ncbi:MAG: exo-alpha-sialidase, partial [Oligoflexales bacterium]|nr:exo-alpha-sialidase [Oligoflexales bacterium]